MSIVNRLTDEQILANKTEFIELIKSIDRPNANIDKLIEKLETSDFFEAPASTNYHGAYKGGLCDHSLNVYYNMMHLLNYKAQSLGINVEDESQYQVCINSVKIVALLHDISKINTYTVSSKNVKVYDDTLGDKSDAVGNFYWSSELSYSTIESENRFVYGSHEMTSEYMVRQFIPLNVQESVAILHHMGSMSWDSAKDNIGLVFNKYPMALLLYMADMLSSYVDERTF